jgi:hypothetical protein
MTRLEKIEMAIEKGYTCDPESGKVYGITGKEHVSKHSEGYMLIRITKDKKTYHLRAHQFIYYCVHKEIVEQIDHINGVKDDNRIENLRAVTHQQNHFNRTKAKGYTWHKPNNKWLAYIKRDGKKIHLGYFDTEEEAHGAYLDAKEIYHII